MTSTVTTNSPNSVEVALPNAAPTSPGPGVPPLVSAPVTGSPVSPANSNKRPSKAAQACDNCKRSHLKCDGEATCARCKKLDYTCTYSDSKKRGPKPSSGSQPLSRRDVQQNNLQQLLFLNARLEQEIKHLQSQVAFWEAKYRLAENLLLQNQPPALPSLPPPSGLQYHGAPGLPGTVPPITHLHHQAVAMVQQSQQANSSPNGPQQSQGYLGHAGPSYPPYPQMGAAAHNENEASRNNHHQDPQWREAS